MIPKTTIKQFLAKTILPLNPFKEYQKVLVWIMAGKANPKADKQKAPKREIKRSSFGMATAKATGKL